MKVYNDWTKDLKDSARAIHSIKDTVLPCLISGSIVSIENATNEILIWMDMYSGIDMVRKNGNGLQGIASRVQFGHAYNTFTIRAQRRTGAKTELEKRLKAIAEGYFYPVFTMQAYFDDRISMKPISMAIIKTVDLYQAILKGKKVKTQKSDNIFKYMHWLDLQNFGYDVKTWQPKVIEIPQEIKPIKFKQLKLEL